MGGFALQALSVAAELKLADLLSTGPRSSDDLARQTATHAPSLQRLLRALASIDIFREDEHQRFSLTPLGQLPRTDSRYSLHAITCLVGSSFQWPAWGNLLHRIRTGECAFDAVFGMDLWAYMAQHPEAHHLFQQAMSNLPIQELQALLPAYDFSGFRTLIDIGGGHGQLLTTILHHYPHMRGVLFEVPAVAEEAREYIEAAGIARRCEIVAGDMFQAIPAGHDGYTLKSIVHNWDDGAVLQLLQTCRAAMPDHATLLLMARVLAPINMPDTGKFMDLNMLVTLGGQERTEETFTSLLVAAGFKLSRIVPTRSPLSILECVKDVPAT